MKKIFLMLWLLFPLILLAQEPTEQYVVMVSLDGFRADYIEKHGANFLKKLGEEGVRVKRMKPANPTKTFPNHYTLATGLYPEHHGLVGNVFYAPQLGRVYKLSDRKTVEDGAFYGGEPIWNTARKAGLKTASFYWVGTEANVQGMQPDIWKKYNSRVSLPQRIDSVVSWLQLPVKERPRLVMLYYNEPDHSGHRYGPDSKEVQEKVHYIDKQMQHLYEKLMQLPIAEKINLIIVSDHGMRSISAKKQIILEDYIKKDWVEGIYGSNPVYTITAKKALHDSVYNALRKIKHLRFYNRGEAPARWKFGANKRIGDFLLVAKSGWSLFAVHAKGRELGGTHGYFNGDRQMAALFVAKGAAFKDHYRQRKLNNVDVYNVVAKILGISPAPNDGNPKQVRRLLK